MEVTSEDLIKFYQESKPRLIFEMDERTLGILRQLRDANGTYLWVPEPNYPLPGTLLGIQIALAKDECFQLRHIFPDGKEHITKFSLVK